MKLIVWAFEILSLGLPLALLHGNAVWAGQPSLVPGGASERAAPTPVVRALPPPIPPPLVAAKPANAGRSQVASQPGPTLPRLPSPEELPFTNPNAFVQPPNAAPQALPVPETLPVPIPTTEPVSRPSPLLSLETVLRSVEQDYPLLAAVFQERGIAAGALVAAEGPFNTKVTSNAKDVPLGFYRYHIIDSYVEQPNWYGGKTFAGYRIGTGPTFPIWFGEFETNTGGEFRAGFVQSLMQGLVIDKRRAEYQKAQIARSTAEPIIRRQRIEFMQAAAISYWEWVGAGRKYVIAQQLLDTAMERDEILAERVRRGDIAPIERTDNQRIIADRQAKLIAAGRKFQEAAIKLSLFYRDAAGLPLLPDPRELPHGFPNLRRMNAALLSSDIQLAYQLRPELRELALKRQALNVDLRWARNQVLPQFDGFVTTAKDVGSETPPIDKTPFQLEAGVVASVPLQRSAARGDILAAQAAIAQVNARTRWYQDKIGAEVQDAISALLAAYDQFLPRRDAVQLTFQMEVAERRKYEVGDSNLFTLNLRELDTRDAASLEIDALVTYFVAEAVYHATLGLDGLRIGELGLTPK